MGSCCCFPLFLHKRRTRVNSSYKKIVIVGDGYCGKTSLLVTYTTGFFPVNYEPTVFDNDVVEIFVGGILVRASLWDTAGQETFKNLRPCCYADTNCFIVTYAVNSPASYRNVEATWMPEIMANSPKASIVLVATKVDLRTANFGFVTVEMGQALSKRIKATEFVETSARLNIGIKQAIMAAARATIN